MELLQLIREAKYPDRMGIEIPESAKIVLFQEEKLKSYYNELSWASSEYEAALQRHGVQAPLRHGQQRLEQLVTNIYDIIQRRVEKNLRIGSRTLLVDLPADESFTVMDFVAMRKSHIGEKGGILQGKNVEIEHAVDDLVKIIVNYQFDTTTEIVAPEELTDESTEESTEEESTGMPTEEPTEEPTDEPCLEILMTTTHSAPTRAIHARHQATEEEIKRHDIFIGNVSLSISLGDDHDHAVVNDGMDAFADVCALLDIAAPDLICTAEELLQQYHERLGHPSFDVLRKLVETTYGLKVKGPFQLAPCKVCDAIKVEKDSFATRTRSRSSFSRTFGSSHNDCRAASPIRQLRYPKTSRLHQISQLLACLSLRRRTC